VTARSLDRAEAKSGGGGFSIAVLLNCEARPGFRFRSIRATASSEFSLMRAPS
jgi:hypothetical protein